MMGFSIIQSEHQGVLAGVLRDCLGAKSSKEKEFQSEQESKVIRGNKLYAIFHLLLPEDM